jgi:hypothetical protein
MRTPVEKKAPLVSGLTVADLSDGEKALIVHAVHMGGWLTYGYCHGLHGAEIQRLTPAVFERDNDGNLRRYVLTDLGVALAADLGQ